MRVMPNVDARPRAAQSARMQPGRNRRVGWSKSYAFNLNLRLSQQLLERMPSRDSLTSSAACVPGSRYEAGLASGLGTPFLRNYGTRSIAKIPDWRRDVIIADAVVQ
jgi:hypothetical protein